MIKNYLTYIREQINHDIDPYGEDDWEDLPPVLEIARKQGKPYDRITYLKCSGKNLIDLEGIERLVNLKVLYCDDNQLISLEGIENLVNLEWLACSNNRLTSLKGIENLVNLKDFDCSSNRLTSLEGIENLVNLETLYCYNNQFTDEYKRYLMNYCKERKIRSKI